MRLRHRAIPLLLLALASPAFAAMQAEPVEWTIGETTFSGVLVHDDANAIKRPGLVMVPNWMGVTDAAVDKARKIAGDDYVVLVADVYGKDLRPKDSTEAGAAATTLMKDRDTLRRRVGKAVEVLATQAGKVPVDADRIGALGFCFGGSAALELVRGGSDIAGVVTFHAGLGTDLRAAEDSARTPVLVLNGADDPSVTDADIAAFENEMDAAAADWQFVNFSGARHCFAESDQTGEEFDWCVYDARAAGRAFEMMRDFFNERFAAAREPKQASIP